MFRPIARALLAGWVATFALPAHALAGQAEDQTAECFGSDCESASYEETIKAVSPGGFDPAEGPPGFLIALRIGPSFSFKSFAGGAGEMDFQFKIRRHSYLSMMFNFHGGYQINQKRPDSLFCGVLGYRHYFLGSRAKGFTLLFGISSGYYATGKDFEDNSYDWLHVGARFMAGYQWFFSRRNSLGIEGGLSAAYQFHEFMHAPPPHDKFLDIFPEARLAVTF